MFVFNRFLTKYYPNMFSLSQEEQDSFKIDNQEEMEDKFTIMLYKQILNISLKNIKDADNYSHLVKDDVLLEFNKQRTYLQGIGKNYFHFNEFFGDNENMLTFKTLYEYDLDNHNYQEQYKVDEKISTEKESYKMRMNFYWARAIIENDFYYLSLTSPANYLHSKIEEELDSIIEELIPHEYKEAENNFNKLDNGFYSFDFKLDANGKEKELEDLKDYYNYKISKKLYDELQNFFFDNPKNKIWLERINNENKTDPHLTYIFSDINVIKNIRFNNWDEDTKNYITEDFSELDSLYQQKLNQYKFELINIYNQIIEGTYISDIKKKKPLKVVASEEFLLDLENLNNLED